MDESKVEFFSSEELLGILCVCMKTLDGGKLVSRPKISSIARNYIKLKEKAGSD